MANSVDLHLNIQNSLEKQLTKSNKQMTSFNDLLSESDLATGKIKKNWIGTVNVMDKAKGALRRLGSTARDLVPAFSVIFSTAIVVESTREVIKHSQAFRELSYRMGDGVESTMQYTQAMTEASKATGLATDDISELIVDLRSLRVPLENIQEAVTITAQFSEVTGVASNSSARLYGELMRTGRMSESMTQSMMLGMTRVQKEFGLSSSEAETLADGLVTITQRMNQLGKSAQETRRMTQGTVALAVAFSKVGIEAGKALEIITDLLDPEQVESNAFLYAKLGISISDAFEGNVDVVGEMIPRMRELGQQLRNMSGPAAVAMARSLGMPLQTLRQFGEIDISQIPEMQRLMTEEGMNASEAFAAMQSKTRGLDKMISAIGNQIRAVIGGLANNLGKELGDAVDSIRNFDLTNVINSLTEMGKKVLEFGKNIDWNEAIEKLLNGIKTFIGFMGNIPKMLPAIGIGIFMLFRTIRRRAYTAFTGMGKDFNKELVTAIDGAFSMMDERLRNISEHRITPRVETGKPGVFSEENIARRNRKMDETLDLQKAFVDRQYNISKTEVEMLAIDKEKIENRMRYLSVQEQSRGLTHREYDEFKNLSKMHIEASREYEREVLRRNRVERRLEEERKNVLKMRSNESLKQLATEAQRQKSNYESSLGNSREAIENQKLRNKEIARTLQLIEQEKQWALAEGNAEAAASLLESESKFQKLKMEGLETLRLEKENRNEAIKKIREIRDRNEEINEIYRRRTGVVMDLSEEARELKGAHRIVSRAMESVGVGYRRAVYGISQVWRGIRDSVGNITDSIRYNTSYFVKQLRDQTGRTILNVGKNVAMAPLKGMKSLTQGFGRALKSNIGRMIGPMAIIGLAMKLLQPVIEELQPVINILTDALKNVFIKILQAIGPPLLRVLSALMPILAMLVNTALPILIMSLGGVMKIINVLIDALGLLVKGISAIPGVGNRLDGVVEVISGIGDEVSEGAINAFQAGREMMHKDNKVLSDDVVKGIQESLTSTADKFASGDIVVSTKEGEDRFGGATVSLDKAGNIVVDYPEKEEKISLEDKISSLIETLDAYSRTSQTKIEGALSGANVLSSWASQFTGNEFQGLHTAINQINRLQDAFDSGEIGHDGFLSAYKGIFEGLINDESLPQDLRDGLKEFYDGLGESANKLLDEEVEKVEKLGIWGSWMKFAAGVEEKIFNFFRGGGGEENGVKVPTITPVDQEYAHEIRSAADAVNDRFRPGGFLNDGVIFKDNKIIQTHEDDHIIASKNKPQVLDDTRISKRSVEERNDNREVIQALQQIVSGIEGMLIEGRKTSENLEHIKGYSNKTASNTRYVKTPSMESL